MKVYGFKEKTKFVPDHDESYVFDEVTTKAILAADWQIFFVTNLEGLNIDS